jgi:PAS domain S-box-containing protein
MSTLNSLTQKGIIVEIPDLTASNKKDAIRILHVDDDPSFLKISKQILLDMNANLEFENACCVEEAFKKLSTEQFDLVISDYGMPQKNGLQFLEELRRQNNRIPFILFTGKSREEIAIKALNLGADRYLNKQGNPETVYGELLYGITQLASQNILRKKLVLEQERFRQMFFNAPMAVAIYRAINGGEDFVFEDFNPAAEKIEKIAKAEVLGKCVTHVFPGVKEFGIFEVFKKVWKTGKTEHFPAAMYKDNRDTGSWRENWIMKLPNDNIASIYQDITERKKNDLEIKQKSEALEKVAETIDSGLAVIGKDYSVVWANKHLMDLGVAPNKKCYQTFSKLNAVCPDCGVRKIFEQNVGLDVHEFETVDSKGEKTWIELRVTPLKDRDGNVIAALELAVPITERKKAELKLIKSEERYRSLADSLPEIVFETDIEGKLTYVNQSAYKIMGYTKEDFNKGICAFDIIGKEDMEKAIEEFKKTIANESSTENKYTCIRKDGSSFLGMVSSKPVVMEGRTIGIRGIVIDITRLKQVEEALRESENRLSAIVANAQIGIATLDVDKRFSTANEAFCKMLGYSEKELRKLFLKDVTYSSDLKESAAKMGELENGVIPSFTLEKRYVKKDGTVINGKIMVSAVPNQNGKPRLFMAELDDITKRKALETRVNKYSKHLKTMVELRTSQLKDANERLVKAERLAAIGELAGMVGHDLRNPLAAIKNASYYLKKREPVISEALTKEMLVILDKAIDHSDRIINDLLEYARDMHIELTDCSMSTLLEAAIGMIHVPDTIQILNHVNQKTNIRVDVNKILRVFINLIKNSIDAMPDKGKLEITSRQTKNWVKIIFADTGIGIPDDILLKLFSPLVTTKAQGMGFGLAICKRVVEAHTGTIKVKTKLNKGTTFTVTLPIELKNRWK